MHLSTHNWMRAEPLETTLARIKKFGYESIEISGEPKQYDTKETRRLLKQYGIRCWGSVTLTLGDRNLAARDEGQRARSVDYVKSVLDMIHDLEGEIITLVPRYRRQDHPGRHARGGMAVARGRSQGML
jgi:sugar phosphate isomerase/epimerase